MSAQSSSGRAEGASVGWALFLLAVVGALIVGVPYFFGGEESLPREPLDLADAAWDGNVENVRRMLAAGADPNEPLKDGMRPLAHAARGGHLDVVALLLARGAAIAAGSSSEKSAVVLALAGGHDAVLRLLFRAGAEIPSLAWPKFRSLAPRPESGPLLLCVALSGDAEVARALVDAGFLVEEPRTLDGVTALSGAAIAGSAPIVELLLAQGASVATRTLFGRTPLHHAALGGVPGIVEHILAAGADPSAVDELGWTPLHLAALCGNGSAVRELAGPAAAAQCLDARDPFGWTPLMRAVTSGDAFAIEALLASGADVHAASASGRTALHVAAERGLDGSYQLLVAAGASEDARDSFDCTPRELRPRAELPLGDPGAFEVTRPIVRARWSSIEPYGADMEFVAWDDGVVFFSDLSPSYPWTTSETLRIGRIPAARARRLSVELEESALFRHPPFVGIEEHHGSSRTVEGRSERGGDFQSFRVPYAEQDLAGVDWAHQPETDATLDRLWPDVQSILTSARPMLTEPLTAHFVERRFIGEGSFRGIAWKN